MHFLPHSKLARAALASLAALGLLAGGAFLTEDASIVQSLGYLMEPIGLAAAVLCGLAYANYVAGAASRPNASTAGFVIIGLLSAWVATSLALAWVIVAAAALLAFVSARYGGGPAPSPAVRYFLIAGAFLGGLLPGAVFYFILAFIVSDRYCQLTSSKCL